MRRSVFAAMILAVAVMAVPAFGKIRPHVIRANGVGSAHFDQTPGQIEAVFGKPVRRYEPGPGSPVFFLDFGTKKHLSNAVEFAPSKKRGPLSFFFFFYSRAYRTPRGVGPGSKMTTVAKKYPDARCGMIITHGTRAKNLKPAAIARVDGCVVDLKLHGNKHRCAELQFSRGDGPARVGTVLLSQGFCGDDISNQN